MNCTTCGTPLEHDSVFCPSCGTVPGAEPTQTLPAVGPEFEPTQHIPVAEPAPAAQIPQQPSVAPPPQPSVTPRPTAPSGQPSQPVFVPERRSMLPIVAGLLVLASLVVLGFLLRGIFSGDDPDTDAPVTTDEVPAVTEAPALESTVAPVETTAAPTLVEAAAGSPYEGNCFAAVVPPGWELVNNDEEVGYGMRTTWRRGGDLLFVDSSPISDPNVTSRDAAAGQLAQRSTATSELIDEGNDAWGYTYTRSGAPAIAIYKVTSRGFGVVGASQNNADQTIADARALIMSIEATNPTCDTGLTG